MKTRNAWNNDAGQWDFTDETLDAAADYLVEYYLANASQSELMRMARTYLNGSMENMSTIELIERFELITGKDIEELNHDI